MAVVGRAVRPVLANRANRVGRRFRKPRKKLPAGTGLAYNLGMSTERTARLSASPPLFRSRFLDFFSRVHPVVPALIFVPIIAALVVLAANDGMGALEIALLALAGLGIWTLSEYWLHRKVFHWEPDHPIGSRMHFIIHGVHHDHPNDKMRLVMPPGASIPLALLFFGIFWLIFGLPTDFPSSPASWSGISCTTTRTITFTTRCRSQTSESACASSTCATTSRITATDTAFPRPSGTRYSGRCLASAPDRILTFHSYL